MFINDKEIIDALEKGKNAKKEDLIKILDDAKSKKGLELYDIAKLLQSEDEEIIEKIYSVAGEIKSSIYGNRVVIFAPLYVSDYCVNNCTYCGYARKNDFKRRRLTDEQIQEEVMLLEKMGHKRIAFEAGEDPTNCDMDYICHAIDTIYNTKNENGNIRRINVNIAATTVENYKRIYEKGIGTYILFQETYHKDTFKSVHPNSIKGNYDYHLTSFDRAMEAGIDDVGGGVLFGLYDYKYEVLALMQHNKHLEDLFNVGFHTISVPRLKKAEGMSLEQFPYIVNDNEFKKLVAILRIAVPFTGLILSTRESIEMREELINYGVSQVSAGSCTGVGAYKEEEFNETNVNQFEVSDNRKPLDVIKDLLKKGFVPSYCTACYRSGRTGDRFMSLAKSGQIHKICSPNALMTLLEYSMDYGDDELKDLVENVIKKECDILDISVKDKTTNKLELIKEGKRDLYV